MFVLNTKIQDMRYFVERLKEACADKGTTPHMVALDCGVSESLMSAIVNGNRNPKPKTWRGIIKKLGQSELLGISEMELFSWRAVDDYPEIEEVIKRGLGSKLSKTVRNKGLNE